MTLSSWLTYLEQLNPHKIILGLERLAPIALQLHLNHFNCPVITVTGTNGKGSCVVTLEAIYKAANYHIGAYTSPHLLRFNERIRINGEEVTDAMLCAAFAIIKQTCDELQIPLTYFEFTTLAALYIFQQAKLDVLILEVGLGGRLDAVNIVDADIAVVTTVDIDHVEWLGNTREMIAQEKAGIFRRNAQIVCGDYDPPQSLLTIVQQLNANWHAINRDFSFHYFADNWQWQSKRTALQNLPLINFELQNVATALMVIEVLQDRLVVAETAIKAGLKSAFLPGRFQQVGNTIFDVAHNPHAARWLAKRLATFSKLRFLSVVGMLADKDISGTLEPLNPYIDSWYLGSLEGPRAANSQQLSVALQAITIKKCYNFVSVEEAYQHALQACEKDNRIVVFGSFYTVAKCLTYLKAIEGESSWIAKPNIV